MKRLFNSFRYFLRRIILFSLIGLLILPLGFSALGYLKANLLEYYDFAETSGTSIASKVSTAMTAVNGPNLNYDGYYGSGVFLDGVNDYINANAYLSGVPYSFCWWAKSLTTTSKMYWGTSGDRGFGLNQWSNTYFVYTGNEAFTLPEHSSTGKLVHWCLVYTNTTHAAVYWNGTLKQENYASAHNYTTRGNYWIGTYVGGSNNWHGMIDEWAVFNKSLTATEVSTLYTLYISGGNYTTIFTDEVILDFNVTQIFDNTTSHVQEFNKSFNILLTGVNATGDIVPQNITLISDDAGLTATNITSNVNYAITLNNESVSNYSFFAYDPFNSSLNITFYIAINDVDNITYMNTSSFFKFNTTQALNFTIFLDDGSLTCDDYFNFTMPAVNISNKLIKSCDLTSITFNNSDTYNYTYYLTNERFGRIINNTGNIYTNAYNLSIPYYNSTIANNSLFTFLFNLDTFPNYSISQQIVNLSINFNNSITYYTTNKSNYSFSQILTTNKIIETINFSVILNLTFNNQSLIFNNTYNVTIVVIQIDDCSTYKIKFLNISIKNEENINQLVPNSTLIGYFRIGNEGVPVPINIYNDTNGIITLCINNTSPFIYSADFMFSAQNYGANDKISREHYFVNAYYNGTIHQQSFYKLQTSLASRKTFTLYDNNNKLLEGYYIRINRWYGNDYSTVAMAKTDTNGLALTYARFYDFAYYQIEILNPEMKRVLLTEPNVFSTENNNIYLTTGDLITYSELLNSYTYNYTYNNVTKLLRFTASTLSGKDASFFIKIYDSSGNLICFDSSTTSSWTKYCNVSGYENFLANGYVFDFANNVKIDFFNVWIKDLVSDYDWGSLGVVLTFFMVLIMGVIGLSVYYPLSPLFCSVGLLLSVIINFINLNLAIPISLIFGSIIIFLFLMKRGV